MKGHSKLIYLTLSFLTCGVDHTASYSVKSTKKLYRSTGQVSNYSFNYIYIYIYKYIHFKFTITYDAQMQHEYDRDTADMARTRIHT